MADKKDANLKMSFLLVVCFSFLLIPLVLTNHPLYAEDPPPDPARSVAGSTVSPPVAGPPIDFSSIFAPEPGLFQEGPDGELIMRKLTDFEFSVQNLGMIPIETFFGPDGNNKTFLFNNKDGTKISVTQGKTDGLGTRFTINRFGADGSYIDTTQRVMLEPGETELVEGLRLTDDLPTGTVRLERTNGDSVQINPDGSIISSGKDLQESADIAVIEEEISPAGLIKRNLVGANGKVIDSENDKVDISDPPVSGIGPPIPFEEEAPESDGAATGEGTALPKTPAEISDELGLSLPDGLPKDQAMTAFFSPDGTQTIVFKLRNGNQASVTKNEDANQLELNLFDGDGARIDSTKVFPMDSGLTLFQGLNILHNPDTGDISIYQDRRGYGDATGTGAKFSGDGGISIHGSNFPGPGGELKVQISPDGDQTTTTTRTFRTGAPLEKTQEGTVPTHDKPSIFGGNLKKMSEERIILPRAEGGSLEIIPPTGADTGEDTSFFSDEQALEFALSPLPDVISLFEPVNATDIHVSLGGFDGDEVLTDSYDDYSPSSSSEV